jgi:membrane dipeptidase
MSVAPSIQRTPDEELAETAGVSLEAVQLLRSSEVVDLHIESYIPPRLWGYDLQKRHGTGPSGGRYFGHLDFPRAIDGGLTAGMWSVATNILRGKKGRLAAVRENLKRLADAVGDTGGAMRVVRSHAEYRQARSDGAHAALLSVQGGNAFEAAEDGPLVIPDRLLTRVTVVHLSNSCYGGTSSPASFLTKARGLTDRGRRFVEQLNEGRIFVDLAHISEQGFWDAIEVHDRDQPLLVTHTGVDGVRKMWRNIDDDQIRAVAETNGVVGVIFHTDFLKRPGGPKDGRMVIEHVRHVIDTVGEDYVALGSDYDGFITPPADLRDGGLAFARLVQHMLDEGWSSGRIQKILGDNFLRTFRQLRPD